MDVDVENIGDEIDDMDNGAPVLYMFFKKGKFDMAEVSADNCVIHLCAASVINAILGYLAVYYVFHVGYSPRTWVFHVFLAICISGWKEITSSECRGSVNLYFSLIALWKK